MSGEGIALALGAFSAFCVVVLPLTVTGIIQIRQATAASKAAAKVADQAREDALASAAAIAAASVKAEAAAEKAAASADGAAVVLADTSKTVGVIHELTNSTLSHVQSRLDEALTENKMLRDAMLADSKSREMPLTLDPPRIAIQEVHVVNPPNDPIPVKQQDEEQKKS